MMQATRHTVSHAYLNPLPKVTPDTETLVPGCLYVVATPIGNLGDFSPRAQSILARVHAICAEDTRTTGLLLSQFGIRRPLLALHDHNETRVASEIVARLTAGESLALVSDAGTPLVSDPGYAVVDAARSAGAEVRTVPGPCALTAALSIAGLATDEFTFAGFMPAKATARRARLQALAQEPRTWVIYEAPHRILECAEDLAAILEPDRLVFVARELTKRFEQGIRLPAGQLLAWFQADSNHQRGEFVLVIAGAPPIAPQPVDVARLLRVLLTELPPSKAAKLASELTEIPRKTLYAQALMLGGSAE